MLAKRFIILIPLFTVFQLFSLNSPVLRCISVNQNGSISINWSKPTDVNGFKSYYIYRSNSSATSFVLIDSLFNINQLTYTDVNVNGNLQSFYFYISSRTLSNTSVVPSDTLQSIHLTVTNTANGIANLTWNHIHNPLLPSSSGKYHIFRKNGVLSNWFKIDSTNLLQYFDTINVCRDSVYYRVEITDNTGCTSVSSVDKKLFEDVIAPLSFGLDSVSVDINTSKVLIGWHPSTSSDVKGYIICHGTPCIALDTIWGKLSSSYIDILFNPCNAAQGYKIAVFDSCFNTSLFSNTHNTIFLSSNYYKCENKINLNWTPYINMQNGLGGYRIMYSKNGGNYSILATVPDNILSYEIGNLQDSTIYCFYIQAFNVGNTITSSSCVKCYNVLKSISPDVLYIKTVSVVGENQIEIKLLTNPAIFVKAYQLYRSESLSGTYNLITSLSYTNTANYSYTDYNVNTSTKVYYYKFKVLDSCGNQGKNSNIAHSILLNGKIYDSYTNELIWTDYGDWAGNVDKYEIYRSVNGFYDINPIAFITASIPGTIYHYLDDVKDFINNDGKFRYYILAREKVNMINNFVENSNSNEVEIVQQPEMYVPNAFSPAGVNKIFKPVSVFMSNENYIFQIYNRYGQIVFETNNPDIGWDGKYLNNFVNQGVYYFIIRYIMPNKAIKQKQGSVTVLF